MNWTSHTLLCWCEWFKHLSFEPCNWHFCWCYSILFSAGEFGHRGIFLMFRMKGKIIQTNLIISVSLRVTNVASDVRHGNMVTWPLRIWIWSAYNLPGGWGRTAHLCLALPTISIVMILIFVEAPVQWDDLTTRDRIQLLSYRLVWGQLSLHSSCCWWISTPPPPSLRLGHSKSEMNSELRGIRLASMNKRNLW